MTFPPSRDVTALLSAWNAGDASALDDLVPIVYAELRRQAERQMRHQPPGHTLRPTGLVHEAYLRLAAHGGASWESRAHFFNVAGRVMRTVLVDHARARSAAKRLGAAVCVTLDAAVDVADPAGGIDVLSLDEALEQLAALDPRKCRIVELRYFVGLTIDETADTLGISPATVKREWTAARAWLKRELSER